MKSNYKIFNDPVYGFITIPQGILLDVIDHPWFQRLRRIKQTGMTHLVYPGALHTRFHHLLGALHLAMQAVDVLQQKGVDISEEEREGLYLAILLHDIGHGPFSHALEKHFVDLPHEEISLLYMKYFNALWPGKLDIAIQIFSDQYPKAFLHQLISGQIDLDRMDYLKRDSFYTGVAEGVIGHDRIIKMLHVIDGQLVVEEKGIYSIEKFLVARRLMYWQVYLHKTSLSAELMLQHFWQRLKELVLAGQYSISNPTLNYFIHHPTPPDPSTDPSSLLQRYASIDDIDIEYEIKRAVRAQDPLLQLLATGLNERLLFSLEYNSTKSKTELVKKMNQSEQLNMQNLSDKLVWQGFERNIFYQSNVKDEIFILAKSGSVKPFAELSEFEMHQKIIEKKFICYPKNKLLLHLLNNSKDFD